MAVSFFLLWNAVFWKYVGQRGSRAEAGWPLGSSVLLCGSLLWPGLCNTSSSHIHVSPAVNPTKYKLYMQMPILVLFQLQNTDCCASLNQGLFSPCELILYYMCALACFRMHCNVVGNLFIFPFLYFFVFKCNNHTHMWHIISVALLVICLNCDPHKEGVSSVDSWSHSLRNQQD